MSETEIGYVQHYFDKIGVAAITLTKGSLAVGDMIQIVGHTTKVETTVASMQIEHQSVQQANVGDAVGLQVPAKVRKQDKVFKVTP